MHEGVYAEVPYVAAETSTARQEIARLYDIKHEHRNRVPEELRADYAVNANHRRAFLANVRVYACNVKSSVPRRFITTTTKSAVVSPHNTVVFSCPLESDYRANETIAHERGWVCMKVHIGPPNTISLRKHCWTTRARPKTLFYRTYWGTCVTDFRMSPEIWAAREAFKEQYALTKVVRFDRKTTALLPDDVPTLYCELFVTAVKTKVLLVSVPIERADLPAPWVRGEPLFDTSKKSFVRLL